MQMRCEDCGETTDVPARLADLAECDECGSENLVDASTWDEAEVSEPQPRTRGRRDGRMTKAESAAHELLLANGIDWPPVDVEAIATGLGLRIIRQDLGKVSGELRGKRIKVNSTEAPVRQRFSIAHEVGHFVLHTVHDSDADSAIERQADAFAAALLMPPGMLKREVARTPNLKTLRRRFQVSEPAIHIAVRRAGLLGQIQPDDTVAD